MNNRIESPVYPSIQKKNIDLTRLLSVPLFGLAVRYENLDFGIGGKGYSHLTAQCLDLEEASLIEDLHFADLGD